MVNSAVGLPLLASLPALKGFAFLVVLALGLFFPCFVAFGFKCWLASSRQWGHTYVMV
jgi:hypothetical protein